MSKGTMFTIPFAFVTGIALWMWIEKICFLHILKQRHRSVEGGGNCAAASRVGNTGSGTPSSIF